MLLICKQKRLQTQQNIKALRTMDNVENNAVSSDDNAIEGFNCGKVQVGTWRKLL